MQQAPISSSANLSNGSSGQQQQQQISGQQNYTPSKYDEAERVRQRMQELRRHHSETVSIHEQTQPIIDKQIHDETVKYLKYGQNNGTKAKSQRPRAPKKAKTAVTAVPTITTTTTTGQYASPSNQQQAYKQTNDMYHQMPTMQPTMQNTMQPTMQAAHSQHIYQQQPAQQPQQQQQQQQQQQHHHHHHQQQQQHYNHHHHQIPPHLPQTTNHQSHYIEQQHYSHQISHDQSYYNYQPQIIRAPNNFPSSTLPTDLDLNLQSGLECDVDYLIKHEMSVEGQLDFNHDLLSKLDNPNSHHHQH